MSHECYDESYYDSYGLLELLALVALRASTVMLV